MVPLVTCVEEVKEVKELVAECAAVLKTIGMTFKAAKANCIMVGMCGEAAADPRLTDKLLEWGLDEFSVTPSSILKTISEHNA